MRYISNYIHVTLWYCVPSDYQSGTQMVFYIALLCISQFEMVYHRMEPILTTMPTFPVV